MTTPTRWQGIRLKYLYRSSGAANHPQEQVLSVYRDYGVIPKASRNDNFNKTPENIDRYLLVRPGDLVVNRMKAWQGSLGVSEHQGIVSGDYEVLNPVSANLDGKFMHYLLRSRHMIGEYRVRSTGIRPSQWRLYWDQMGDMTVQLPLPEEQRAIADFLDREVAEMDALIDVQQRFIDQLQRRRFSMVAVAVEKYSHNPVSLKHIATIQTGITLSGDGDPEDPEWPYLRVANVQMGYMNLDEIKMIRASRTDAQKSMVRPGDVLMTEGGDIDKLGRGAVWQDEVPNALHQNHIFATRPGNRLDPRFLMYYLDGPIARNYFRITAKKTTNLASTNKWTTGNLPVGLPPLDEQRRIVTYLDEQTTRMDLLIATAQENVELVRKRKAALITAAVTGQKSVPVTEQEAA
ncbi:hypothetical protein [Streptomyces microflavus]